jgi:colicin import membrane protein
MPQAARVERSSDRWLSLVLSVLLHGGLFAAIGYTWWTYKQDRPQPTLAIEASVVDAKSVPGIGKLPPQPEAPPPPAPPQPTPEAQPQVEPDGPPQPTPEELARREQEQKQQAEREEQAKQAEQAKQLELDRQREEQERQQEQALAEEKAAQEKREAEDKKAALDKAEAERKAAEAKKRAEEQQKAEQQKAEQQANTEREADLQRSLNQEIHQDQIRNSAAMTTWQSQIMAAIQSKWEQPATARSGIVCVLDVTQLPGGTVTNVRIGSCNGDQAVRETIQTAVYKASPLPPPPDPALFQRELIITFRPN